MKTAIKKLIEKKLLTNTSLFDIVLECYNRYQYVNEEYPCVILNLYNKEDVIECLDSGSEINDFVNMYINAHKDKDKCEYFVFSYGDSSSKQFNSYAEVKEFLLNNIDKILKDVYSDSYQICYIEFKNKIADLIELEMIDCTQMSIEE